MYEKIQQFNAFVIKKMFKKIVACEHREHFYDFIQLLDIYVCYTIFFDYLNTASNESSWQALWIPLLGETRTSEDN